MAVKVMKVSSSKGQVTLPREVRKILGSDVVTYDVRGRAGASSSREGRGREAPRSTPGRPP